MSRNNINFLLFMTMKLRFLEKFLKPKTIFRRNSGRNLGFSLRLRIFQKNDSMTVNYIMLITENCGQFLDVGDRILILVTYFDSVPANVKNYLLVTKMVKSFDGQNRHQHFEVITNLIQFQQPSSTSMQPIDSVPIDYWQKFDSKR